MYREPAPWDVGAAQRALSDLFESHPPESPALDVGCGTGDLAIHLAQRGLSVLGVDFIEAPIVEARARASTLLPEIRDRVVFEVADALRPSLLKAPPAGAAFAAVVDSGFLHLFENPERDRFAEDLAVALKPGGRYYLLGFAVTFPGDNLPRAVEEAEVRERFSAEKGWKILHLAPATFASRVGEVPALAACIERSHPSDTRT